MDVRDAARAFWLAARAGRARSRLQRLFRPFGQHVVPARASALHVWVLGNVVPDPDRMRPADIPLLVGDPTLFNETPGLGGGDTIRADLGGSARMVEGSNFKRRFLRTGLRRGKVVMILTHCGNY